MTASHRSHTPRRVAASSPRASSSSLGVLLLVVSILSTYVKREALDSGQFRQTSQKLIADPAIQEAVAAQMTDALANVDFTSSLEAKLPTNLQALASPIAGLAQGFVGTAAENLLARPRIQDAFVDLAVLSQTAVRQGPARRHEGGGHVERQRRPRHPAARPQAGRPVRVRHRSRRPDPAGRRAGHDPRGRQSGHGPEAHPLARADRELRLDLRASPPGSAPSGWPVGAAGRRFARSASVSSSSALIVLVVRWLAGKYIVDQLVATDSMRPAVHNAWQIITQSLAAAGWVALVVGILVAIGAWLVGPGDRATALARALAPHLRRPEIAWSAFVVGMLLLIWLLPIQVFRTTVGARRRVCDRLRRLPAPAQGGVAGAGARGAPRATRSATGGRRRASGSAQAAGRQSSQRPCSTTSWARMP